MGRRLCRLRLRLRHLRLSGPNCVRMDLRAEIGSRPQEACCCGVGGFGWLVSCLVSSCFLLAFLLVSCCFFFLRPLDPRPTNQQSICRLPQRFSGIPTDIRLQIFAWKTTSANAPGASFRLGTLCRAQKQLVATDFEGKMIFAMPAC